MGNPNILALKVGNFPLSLYRALCQKEVNIAEKWSRLSSPLNVKLHFISDFI